MKCGSTAGDNIQQEEEILALQAIYAEAFTATSEGRLEVHSTSLGVGIHNLLIPPICMTGKVILYDSAI